MHAILTTLAENPLLLLAVLLLVGSLLGEVRIARVSIGPAAVLFGAIAVSAYGMSQGVKLEVPEIVGTLGLVLFTYTVGVVSGPNFFASVRRGWPMMLLVAGVFAVVAALGVVLGRGLGLSSPNIAGTFAGALTNTPALAAAAEESGHPAAVTTGYSIAYIWGVIGMMIVTAWTLRRPKDEDAPTEPLRHVTIRVDHDVAHSVAALEAKFDEKVSFTRVKHEHFANPTELPVSEEYLQRRDLVTVVGPQAVVDRVVEELGHVSSHNIVDDRKALDYRRITVSNPRLAGRTIGQLELEYRFGAHISRVRRADQDMVAHDGFVLQQGDRVRVICARKRMGEVGDYLGDSDRGMSDINPVGFALGLSLGLLLGLVNVPLPGGRGFEVGAAAGTLVVGLVFGRMGRVGPVRTSMANSAAQSISHLGMIVFLAYAGTRAGERFQAAVTSSLGWKIAVLGFAITTLAAVALVAGARRVGAMGGMRSAGLLAGAQTQPAVLAFANDKTGSDSKVAVGYALVYPAAMIAKIVIAQIVSVL